MTWLVLCICLTWHQQVALEANERELAAKGEAERQLLTKSDLLSSRLKMATEENRRLEATGRDRDTQYRHELRKKEREAGKLKERLHALLADRSKKVTGRPGLVTDH